MRLGGRLTRLEEQYRDRPRRDLLSVLTAVPVGEPEAERRGPGLYRSERVGSTAGVLVFDPARGEPVVPDGALAAWGLVIVCGPDEVEPPKCEPVW